MNYSSNCKVYFVNYYNIYSEYKCIRNYKYNLILLLNNSEKHGKSKTDNKSSETSEKVNERTTIFFYQE